MDLILSYPNDKSVYIGFFMLNIAKQGKGIGTQIINSCTQYLKQIGFKNVKLGFVKGNLQAEHFWLKNKFNIVGQSKTKHYTVVKMQLEL